VNERSISAQESFVAIFKNNNRGLTIGRPTPGSYDGLCSGNKRKIILKNSNFEIRIPLHASYRSYLTPTNYKQGVGIPPDIEVDETIADILAGIDLPMEVALDRIKDKVQ
jgi:C-terminal processing protease CtpA/Prc